MAISFDKYVKITSGVGGAAAASRRDLGCRVFTANEKLAYQRILTCTSADDVGAVFGTDSKEYSIAVNYFGYVSNSITQAKQISFARWMNADAKKTTITAQLAPMEIANFNGKIGIKFTYTSSNAIISLENDDPYGELTYSDIANQFTAAMLEKSNENGYSWFAGSSCSFVGGVFVFTFVDASSSATSGPNVSISAFTDTSSLIVDARKIMGLRNYNIFTPSDWVVYNEDDVEDWEEGHEYKVGDFVKNTVGSTTTYYCCKAKHTSGTSFVSTNWSAKPTTTLTAWDDATAYSVGDWRTNDGSTWCCVNAISAPTGTTNPVTDTAGSISSETVVNALTRVNRDEDNFGSFMFVETLSDDEKAALAATNDAYNYKYIFLTYALPSGYGATATKLNGYNCTCATYENRQTEFAEFMPAALFASTDYTRVNSTKTFMYKQFDGINPSVGLKTESGIYGNYANLYQDLDAKRLNYYGETMKSGKPLRFYQDGVNMDGTETSVACNEIWFKDAIQTEIINLFIAMEKVPANTNGSAMLEMMIDGVCTEALNNGTIIKTKTLTNVQKAYIDSLAGETDAWKSVYANGYWKTTVIKQETTAGGTKYVADYVLIYSKGDAIRKVTGSNVMI